MKTIAIANHKGGVGKTATTHALGAALALRGKRTLLIDIDPQSSLTASCGVKTHETEGESMLNVMGTIQNGDMSLPDILFEVTPHLDLAPSDIALSQSELGLVTRRGREYVLRRALETVQGEYDVILVDCPPSLGLLTVNALAAADGVLIPTQAQITDLRGLTLFLQTLKGIQGDLNAALDVIGILVTFYDARLIHHRDAMDTMREMGLNILPVTIGRSVRVAEPAAIGESVVTYEPDHKQAAAYRQLAKVIDEWLERKQK